MKHFVIVMVFVATPGCLLELLGTTAIQGELAAENAAAATGVLRQAERLSQETSVESALRLYRAEHGGNPRTLDELVPDYLPAVPVSKDGTRYGYNPRTGKVTRPAAKSALSIVEQREMKRMKNAIQRYKNETGYYPPSLKALVHFGYLTSAPNASNGREYIYNPATGELFYPPGRIGLSR